jgi:hypothetical protein
MLSFQNLIITLFFKKKANLFAENWEKSLKIVNIASNPETFFSFLRALFEVKHAQSNLANWLGRLGYVKLGYNL